ncbi:MAG: acetyltransferase [Candidatus Margulisiibacteriota bacterium]
MKKKIILIGGGGHCCSVIDVIKSTNQYEIIGIIDPKIDEDQHDYNYLGDDSQILNCKSNDVEFLITIGKIGPNNRRVELYEFLKNNNCKLAKVISPFAYVSRSARIGEGSIVMHHALVNSNVKIGNNCILNTKSLVEHDSIIGHHSHISTASVVNGGVELGTDVFLGSHSTINLNVKICDEVSIASNSLVTKSIKQHGIYKGVPVNG